MLLRCIFSLLIAVIAVEPAAAAESPVTTKRTTNAARQLPPGLPHKHYKYRTTIAPPDHRPEEVAVPELPGPLAPLNGAISYIPTFFARPLLPGSSTIPGYYGGPTSFNYQGPYYGGPYTDYSDRLPYACGVYGYC